MRPGPQSTPESAASPLLRHAHGVTRRHAEVPDEPEPRRALEPQIDPLFCQMALHPGITPPTGQVAGAPVPAALPLREDLQNLITGLARRVAWGGDRRKGSARIELSEGALAGATLVVHTEQRSVSVELELPDGAGTQGWQARIQERLEARGFSAHVRVG